jgi:hypothetical protein
VTHGPAFIIGRYAQRSIGDIREDKERDQRLAAARERRQDAIDARVFKGESFRSHQDVMREALALGELQDAEDARRAKSDREQRLEAEAARLNEQLLAAQRQHAREQSRSLGALSTANQLVGRARKRESADGYYRSYGGGYHYSIR